MLPFPAWGLARWTRDSHRRATILAVRHLLRRPAEARAVLPVAVALSIAAFAVIDWADARHNRADPSGQWMAVAYPKLDGGVPPLIAVDTARFASVGARATAGVRAAVGAAGVLTSGVVIVFVVVSIAVARLVERTAGPSQLRGAQQ